MRKLTMFITAVCVLFLIEVAIFWGVEKFLWYPAHPDRVVLLINYHQSCLCGYFNISRIQEPIPGALHCMGFFGGLIFAPIRSCPSLVIRSTPFLGNVYLRYLSGHLLLASL